LLQEMSIVMLDPAMDSNFPAVLRAVGLEAGDVDAKDKRIPALVTHVVMDTEFAEIPASVSMLPALLLVEQLESAMVREFVQTETANFFS